MAMDEGTSVLLDGHNPETASPCRGEPSETRCVTGGVAPCHIRSTGVMNEKGVIAKRKDPFFEWPYGRTRTYEWYSNGRTRRVTSFIRANAL